MLTVERQGELLEILKREKSATVAGLSKKLFASEATVRRDLAALEAQGYLKRVHGGAVIGGAPDREIPYAVRESVQERAKEIWRRVRRHFCTRGMWFFWTVRRRRFTWWSRWRGRRMYWW